MADFGQDFLKKKIDKLVDHYMEDLDAACMQFDELNIAMRHYADRSGGTFSLGTVDPPGHLPEFRFQFPISYFFPDPGEDLEPGQACHPMQERAMGQASIQWGAESHNLILYTTVMGFMMTKMKMPVPAVDRDRLPWLTGHCLLKPRKAVALMLTTKSSVRSLRWTAAANLTGAGMLLLVIEKFVSINISSIEARVPHTFYLCPIADSRVEESYLMRCSSVPVGEAFARDTHLAELLLESQNKVSLIIGFQPPGQASDCTLTLTARPNPTVKEIGIMHQLIARSLALLEQTGVIAQPDCS